MNSPARNRVVRIHQTGGPEVLQIEDLPAGEPGPGQARLRIGAIGLNRSEAAFRSGHYLVPPKLPALMGYEACGVVEAVGEGVTQFKPGDRVCVLPNYMLGAYGVYADRALLPASSLIAPPPGLSAVQAAAVWMPYFTAFGIVQAGRAGLGVLSLVGLTELIAETDSEFVARAASLSRDLPALSTLRAGLRARLRDSDAMNGARFTTHFEAALRGAWRTWCASRPDRGA